MLDIEWAHAIAPGASIDLVEASNDTNNNDIFQAVQTAASLPGRLGRLDELGHARVRRPDGRGFHVHHAERPPGGDLRRVLGRLGLAGLLPGLLAERAGGRRHHAGPGRRINTVQGETAWSGSGGGTSQYEPEPAYQQGFQGTGQRTMPDVAWDADPNTGVAIYDSWDNTDGMGDWYEIGGTSVAAPSWSGLIAIADQGRAIEGVGSLDGATQTLPAIYYAPASDFNDITQGSNGGFSAGPGYDEVTGRGTPVAPRLVPDLVSFGAASQLAVTAEPPSQVIAGDTFGVAVSAEAPGGEVDPSFNGTVTLAMGNDPTGAPFKTVTVTASRGVAVFDGLSLSQLGSGYTFTIGSSSFASVTTAPFAIIADPTPASGTYYPVPTDASLRADIAAAESRRRRQRQDRPPGLDLRADRHLGRPDRDPEHARAWRTRR